VFLVQAAGAIHSDFERGFICAEVMHYEELRDLGSEAAVKAAGKYRQEARTTPGGSCDHEMHLHPLLYLLIVGSGVGICMLSCVGLENEMRSR
jgi:hypothetical protein